MQTLALISLSILTLASHQTERGSCYFGSRRCSMDSAASCGRLSSLSDEALTWEGVMRLILTLISSVLPSQAACEREPHSFQATFFFFLSAPRLSGGGTSQRRSQENVGEEKEKSQFSQPHWWLPYGVFGEKHLWILPLKLLSTVCCCLDIITQVFCLSYNQLLTMGV